jgi:hypothetical protein
VKVATVRLHEPRLPASRSPRYVHLAVTDKRFHVFGSGITPGAVPNNLEYFDIIQAGHYHVVQPGEAPRPQGGTVDVVSLRFPGRPPFLVEFHVPRGNGGFTFAQWIWFMDRERNGIRSALSYDVRRYIASKEYYDQGRSKCASVPASTTSNGLVDTAGSGEDLAPPQPPAARLLRTPRDGEEAAAEWMTWMGLGHADVTQASRDGGIDVISSVAAGQVKMEMAKTTRPTLQQLFGAARADSKAAVFFSLYGYANDAVGWADHARMALFTFDFQGEPCAVNEIARKLMSTARSPGVPAQRGARALSCFDPF